MITEAEIRGWQLRNQHLAAPAQPLDAVRDLLGLQAQVHSCAVHALSIRSCVFDHRWMAQRLIKNWTFRGTMHLFAREDQALYLRLFAGEDYRLRDFRKPTFWNQRACWALTPDRQGYFTDVILEALADGSRGREELKEICRKAGMTAPEEGSMFDPWGGGVRELCQRGFIHYEASDEKRLSQTPLLDLPGENEARRRLTERYFRNYGSATLHDFQYFFHLSERAAREWISGVPLERLTCGNKTYYYSGERPANAPIPDCLFLSGFDPLMLGYEKKGEPVSAPGMSAAGVPAVRDGAAGWSAGGPGRCHMEKGKGPAFDCALRSCRWFPAGAD